MCICVNKDSSLLRNLLLGLMYARHVKDRDRAGILKTHRYNDKGMVLFEDPGENVPIKWATQRGLTIWGSKLEFVVESTEEVQYEV